MVMTSTYYDAHDGAVQQMHKNVRWCLFVWIGELFFCILYFYIWENKWTMINCMMMIFMHIIYRVLCTVRFVVVIVLCGFSVHFPLHFPFELVGIVVGVGATMVRESSAVMLGHYFKRRRQFVEMITMSGEGVGIALFSVILKEGLE